MIWRPSFFVTPAKPAPCLDTGAGVQTLRRTWIPASAGMTATITIAWPQWARACAVCFGQEGSQNLVKAYTWGLILMLGFTFLLMSVLALTIYRIETHRKG